MTNPSPSPAEYLEASEAVYSGTTPPDLTLLSTTPPASELIQGFFAEAFRDNNGNIIIAYDASGGGGWQSSVAYVAGSLDADATIFFGGTPAALGDASVFLQTVAGSAAPGSNIYVTGWSLGGAEAEAAAAAASGLGIQIGGGDTFGAPAIHTINPSSINLTDYVDYGDPVGNFSSDTQPGNYYTPPGMTHVGNVEIEGSHSSGVALQSDAILYADLVKVARGIGNLNPFSLGAAKAAFLTGGAIANVVAITLENQLPFHSLVNTYAPDLGYTFSGNGSGSVVSNGGAGSATAPIFGLDQLNAIQYASISDTLTNSGQLQQLSVTDTDGTSNVVTLGSSYQALDQGYNASGQLAYAIQVNNDESEVDTFYNLNGGLLSSEAFDFSASGQFTSITDTFTNGSSITLGGNDYANLAFDASTGILSATLLDPDGAPLGALAIDEATGGGTVTITNVVPNISAVLGDQLVIALNSIPAQVTLIDPPSTNENTLIGYLNDLGDTAITTDAQFDQVDDEWFNPAAGASIGSTTQTFANGDSITFDDGTISAPGYDASTGTFTATLTAATSNDALAFLSLNTATGIGTLTLNDSVVLGLGATVFDLTNVPANAYIQNPGADASAIQTIQDYLSNLGQPTSLAAIETAEFNAQNPTGVGITYPSDPLPFLNQNGQRYDSVYFNPSFGYISPGSVINGLTPGSIDGSGGIVLANFLSASNSNLSQDTITGIQVFSSIGGSNPNVLTQAEYESFQAIVGNEALGFSQGGTYSLNDGQFTNGTLYDNFFGYDSSEITELQADSVDGTTLIGDNKASETLIASPLGNDTLQAGNGAQDMLVAGDGTDTLIGGSGGDYFLVGAGIQIPFKDPISGAVPAAGSVIDGTGSGNILITNGDIGDLAISGIQILDAGNVTLTNNQFNDFSAIDLPKFNFDNLTSGTILAATSGVYDLAAKSTGDYSMIAEDWGGTTLIGNDANGETLTASLFGNDTLEAGNGNNDVLQGGDGNSTLIAGNGDNDILYAGNGNSTLTAGSGASDQLYGGDGTDTLIGGNTGDTFYDGTGADTMEGGSGNDTFIVTIDQTSPTSFGAVTPGTAVIGGGGADVLEVSGDITCMTLSGVQTLQTNGVTITAAQFNVFGDITTSFPTNFSGTINAATGGTYNLGAVSTLDFNMVAESSGGTRLIGDNAAGEILTASASGNDTLIGGSGNDTYNLGGGIETVQTGSGNDTIIAPSGLAAGSSITGGGGTNILEASGDISGATVSGVQTLQTTDIALNIGEFNGFNSIVNNLLFTGTITAVAGGVFDLATKSTAYFDMVAESSNATTLIGNSANGETLTATGSGNDTLEAGSGFGDVLYAGNGADTLIGGSGDDTFYAGTGVDTMTSGSGFNTFIANSGLATGSKITGGGYDTLQADGDISGAAISGVATLEPGSVTLTGNQFNSFSSIFAFFGPASLSLTTPGIYSIANDFGLIDLAALSPGGTTLIGNNFDSETLTASASGNDTLLAGDGNNDILTGGGGNDTFVAGSGIDTLLGGSGNNTFAVNGVLAAGSVINGDGNSGNAAQPANGGRVNTLVINNGDISNATVSNINALQITGTATLSYAQYTADAGLLSAITNPYNLSVTDVTAANAVTVADSPHVTSITVLDSSANCTANIASLRALASRGVLTAIYFTDTTPPVLTVTPTQLSGLAPFLQLVKSYLKIEVSGDTAVLGDGVHMDFIGSNDTIIPGLNDNFGVIGTNASIEVNPEDEVFLTSPNGVADPLAPLGNNALIGSGNSTLTDAAGINVMVGNRNATFVDPGVTSGGTVTVWGGTTTASAGIFGGSTIDYSNYTGNLQIVLGQGEGPGGPTGWVADSNYHYLADLNDIDNVIGGSGNDVITGNSDNDVINGGSGNDWLVGGSGNDTFIAPGALGGTDTVWGGTPSGPGGFATVDYSSYSGNLQINLGTGTGSGGPTGLVTSNGRTLAYLNGISGAVGGSGANTFSAGPGNDTLTGGSGQNTYNFGGTFGQDVVETGGSSTPNGTIAFTAANDEDLWFQQNGFSLTVDLLGTNDSVTINNWYGGSAGAQVQSFTAGGLTLDTHVSQLVQAMATYAAANANFNPATAAQMPNDAALQTAIAASWHA